MAKEKKKLPLAAEIFIGLIFGIGVGVLLMDTPRIAVEYIKPIGGLFLNLIKFIVVPIVLFSIMSGVISMRDMKQIGGVGLKTIVFYMCTTAVAVVIGLTMANVCKGFFTELSTSGLEYEAVTPPHFMDTMINIFPTNIVEPFLYANMLQIIVIALVFGFATVMVGEQGKVVAEFVESANAVSMFLMNRIIKLSPIGVFCLIVPVVAENGTKILGDLVVVLLAAYLAYALHMGVVYSAIVRVWAGVRPIKFFKEMLPAMIMAFSSASSVGTLPLNLECVQKLGAKKEVAGFVLPLGATINMDGTAIYQGICAVFVATAFGITLTLEQQITIVLTTTLASVGTAGVPGAGMIMLAMVLQSVGLPVEGIALVAGIDRIFDMGRTTVNIMGDAACTLCVSKTENGESRKVN